MIKGWKPTPGNCFHDSYTLLTEARAYRNAVLCHGYPRLTRPDGGRPAGTVYAHAWLETKVRGPDGSAIWFAHDHLHLDYPVMVDLFYEVGQIDPGHVRRYTIEEAMIAALKFEHYGPWDGTV